MKIKKDKKDIGPAIDMTDRPMIAKKDFKIVQNDYERVIVKGEDIEDVPERYWDNLKSEGII